MSPSRWAVPLLLPGLLAIAPPKEVARERRAVESRLANQKEALELLQDQKVSALEVLDLYDRLAHAYLERVRWLDGQVKQLEQLSAAFSFERALTRRAISEKVKSLGPRLLLQYRLSRRRTLEVLLPAKDLAALVWRARTLTALNREDLEDLEQLQSLSRFSDSLNAEADALDAALANARVEAKAEAQHAANAKAELSDAVAYIQAKANVTERVIADLNRADAELSRMIHDLTEAPTSGFGALRGKLPLPVDGGHIEVGYGNVLNPKFNTVTLHKGFDIRAPLGTPVRAIAAGKVVYAAWLRGYGNLMIIDHGQGYFTLMAHLARFAHRTGDVVRAGEEVGQVGDTGSLKGAYLYFEIRERGQAVDPAAWLK